MVVTVYVVRGRRHSEHDVPITEMESEIDSTSKVTNLNASNTEKTLTTQDSFQSRAVDCVLYIAHAS